MVGTLSARHNIGLSAGRAALPRQLLERAAALGMPGIAVTDQAGPCTAAECYLLASRFPGRWARSSALFPVLRFTLL